jgi:coproporphyrinogen III oxidase
MTDWTAHTARAQQWFEGLRDQICAAFEAIEREAGSDSSFDYTPWRREEEGNEAPGGGVRGVMKGRVFEKVGVNVSTVHGRFDPGFAATIHGADEANPGFTATGISLVAHMANPHVPAVHMNTRFLTTGKAWFGGGADLNPPIPYDDDTAEFHAAFRAACMKHNPTYYDRFSTSVSPRISGARSSTCFPGSFGGAWKRRSRPRKSAASSNGAAATPNSTSSTTAARCSA